MTLMVILAASGDPEGFSAGKLVGRGGMETSVYLPAAWSRDVTLRVI